MLKLIIFLRPFARYLLIAWALTIIIVSSIPNIPTLKIHTEQTEIRLDYLIHFCEYGFLAFVAFLSFAGKDFSINYRKVLLILTGLILFGCIDEFHQKLIPGRRFNIIDLISNMAGILAGMAFCLVVFRYIVGRLRR